MTKLPIVDDLVYPLSYGCPNRYVVLLILFSSNLSLKIIRDNFQCTLSCRFLPVLVSYLIQ